MKCKATVEVMELSFGGEDDVENDSLLELLRQEGFEHRLLPDDAKLPSLLLLQTLPRAAKQEVRLLARAGWLITTPALLIVMLRDIGKSPS